MKNLLAFVVAAGILVAIATTVITAQGDWINDLYDWAKGKMGISSVVMLHLEAR